MLCPSCGRKNADHALFCERCGESLPLICPQCGRNNDRGAVFCNGCGAPVTPAAGMTAESAIPVGQTAVTSTFPASFKDGRYTVKELLGEGATKTVYLVLDTLLDREVAFALINIRGLDQSDRSRIQREAQTMAKLGEHPNIVQIYDFGQDDGRPFMVLQLIAGGTADGLAKSAQGGIVDFQTVTRVSTDVCKGLEFAHSKGVVHRDLKPGNIWLSADGVAMIGDFGIALSPSYTRVTQSGMVLGTVAYMSPEQATGGQVDERSDLLLLGRRLVRAGHRPTTLPRRPSGGRNQSAYQQPSGDAHHHQPPRLELLILQLLAKDPDERPPSASAVLESLESIAKAPTSTLTEVDRKPLRALIIDNSDDDTAELIRALQEGGYEPTFERVDRALAMNNALETGEWDVVIADYSIPHFSVPAALKVMQMNELDLPFIIVSRQISEEIAVEAMRAGAHDYVMKDNLSRLVPAVERELLEAVVRRARRIKEDEEGQMKAQLEQRVTELTALNNLFQEHMRQRSDVIQAYRELVEGLQKLPQGLETLARETDALVKRAQAQPIPDLQDVPQLEPTDRPPTDGPKEEAPPPRSSCSSSAGPVTQSPALCTNRVKVLIIPAKDRAPSKPPLARQSHPICPNRSRMLPFPATSSH